MEAETVSQRQPWAKWARLGGSGRKRNVGRPKVGETLAERVRKVGRLSVP
jgi:hypothetical protein